MAFKKLLIVLAGGKLKRVCFYLVRDFLWKQIQRFYGSELVYALLLSLYFLRKNPKTLVYLKIIIDIK